MKKISLVVPKCYHPNRIFDIHDPVFNRDNSAVIWFSLKQRFAQRGIDISTQDVNPVRDADLVIFENMPAAQGKDFKEARFFKKKMYLKISEAEAIHQGNRNLARNKDFLKIFTYQDDLVDGKKYLRSNYAFRFPDAIPKDMNCKQKLCVMIAGNKMLHHPYGLYAKRREIVRWFEKNHPPDFDLYGIGWDRPALFTYPVLRKVFDHGFLVKKIFGGAFPSWRGRVESKQDTFVRYKFSVCYENSCYIRGYITEKIFDCFFAGCVPVYWGAPNVADHIPADTFIDKRKFQTYEELYGHLKNMSDEEYDRYLSSIERFLRSPQAEPFSVKCFVETIVNEAIKDI